MIAGCVGVFVAAVVVALHVLVFRVLDGLIGVPLTLGVFLLVYVAILMWMYREELRFLFMPRRFARLMPDLRPGPAVQPPRIALFSLDMVDKVATRYENFGEPELVQTAELLRVVRTALHDAVSENVGDEHRFRVLEEHYGLLPVGTSAPGEHLPYLYVHEYTEVSSSGYPPRQRLRRETLAHSWKIESDRYGKGEVMLTVGRDRKPWLTLKPEFRRFPATAAGWRELAAALDHPD